MIVCDTGPLYAAADTDDAHHDECLTVFESVLEPLVVPLSVVVEASLLVEGRLGSSSEAQFLRSLASRPPDVRPIISIERLEPSDLLRTAELVETYADLPLGTVDASVVAVAERLGPRRCPRLTAGTSPSSALPTWTPSRCFPES